MYCPKCGTKLIDSCKFCPKCGTKMPVRNVAITPKEQKPVVEPATGKKEQAVQQPQQLQQVSEPTKSSSAVKRILICIGVLLIIGAGVFFGTQYLSSDSQEQSVEACVDSLAPADEEVEDAESPAIAFVRSVYEYIIKTYNADKDEDFDKKFCSKEYNEIAKRANDRNYKEMEEGYGNPLFDVCHWTNAQDYYNLSLVSVTEKETVGDETKIMVVINNFGQDTEINLSIKKENGKYVVSDFDGELQFMKDYLNSPYNGMKLKDVCKLEGVEWVVSNQTGGNYTGFFLAVKYKGQEYTTNASYSWARGEEITEGLTEIGTNKLNECPPNDEITITCTPDDFTDDAVIMVNSGEGDI